MYQIELQNICLPAELFLVDNLQCDSRFELQYQKYSWSIWSARKDICRRSVFPFEQLSKPLRIIVPIKTLEEPFATRFILKKRTWVGGEVIRTYFMAKDFYSGKPATHAK